METIVADSSGRDAINIFLKRAGDGLSLTVRAKPEVEAFFQRWGGGAQTPPEHGRYWRSDKGVRVWSYYHAPDSYGTNPDGYTLTHTGMALNLEEGLVNLSFLRLVGLTEGVTITLDQVMSKTQLATLSNQLLRAADRFYQEYIQPVGMRVILTLEEER